MKRIICLLLSIALGIGMVGCGSNGSSILGGKRTTFSIEYSAKGIENFANIVCKNVNGNAEITDVHTGDTYWTVIEIKLSGKVSEDTQLCFYNSEDSDMVSFVGITIHNPESENEFNCEKELIMALERALTGSTSADKYIKTYNDMYNLAFSKSAGKTVIIAEYELSDGLYAVTTAYNLGMSWVAEYHLYTQSAYQLWLSTSQEYR